MKTHYRHAIVIIFWGLILLMVSSCAQTMYVPSSPEQASAYNHPYIPQSEQSTVQVAQQPATTLAEEEKLIMQLDDTFAEVEAYIQSGDARLREDNVLEAVREYERARILLEQDLNPMLSQVNQIKTQGGMSILTTSQIQRVSTLRSDMLARINRSYDFRGAMYEQQALDKFGQLQQESQLTPVPLSEPSSRKIVVKDRQDSTAGSLVRPEINGAFAAADVDRNILLFQRRHDDFLNCLQRANRYFPQITSILAAEGVPEYLAYIALLESGYQPLAKSSAGKAGLWQFPPSLARQYGLRVSSSTDERFNINASTQTFARYMRQLYRQFGSWELAIIKYSPERDYLAKLVAATNVANNPQAYGFHVSLPNMTGRYSVQGGQQSGMASSSTMLLLEPPVSTLY